MKNIKFLLFVLILCVFNINSFAGWIIKQRSYDSDLGVESAVIETVYLQDNKMKIIQDQIITIFDLNEETITLMNAANKVYWTGKVDDYKSEVKAAMKIAMDEQMEKASIEQQEMIRKMYTGMMENIDNPSKFVGEEPDEYNIEIEKSGEKVEIADQLALKYEVIINGFIKEEAWISESVNTNTEFAPEKFYAIFKDFICQEESMAAYQTNEKYIQFSKKGFPLKSINYYGGFESISEVISLDKKNIEESNFEIPADFKKVNIVEIGIEQE